MGVNLSISLSGDNSFTVLTFVPVGLNGDIYREELTVMHGRDMPD